MRAWFNEVKKMFEKKPVENNNVNIRDKRNSEGFVKAKTNYFEGLMSNNSPKQVAKKDFKRNNIKEDKSDSSETSKDKSYEFFNETSKKSNMEKTPSMVMNNDNICIFQSEDTVYGSFKKRPKFLDQNGNEENEVVMRLKVREEEHLGINRYESILKTPLSQQVIVNRYKSDKSIKTVKKDPTEASSFDTTDRVSTMVNKWNKQCLSNKEQENIIDMALLNSIRKSKITKKPSEKPLKMLQLMQDNRDLKWSDTERVRNRKLVDMLSREEVMFQESQFELISSEASFYRSLNVLVDKFYHSPLLALDKSNDQNETTFQIKPHQKEHLFSNILQIHSISGNFLSELEKRFAACVIMKDVSDIVSKYAKGHFDVYVTYIQNQKFQTEAYNELKKNVKAAKVIHELESQPECCSLSLDSFLLLPMQRLLRILLLLKAIKKHVPQENSLSLTSVEAAIVAIDKIINNCSHKKDLMDERQRMLEISRSLKFKQGETFIPISSGTLLYEGEVKCSRKPLGTKNYLSSIRKAIYDAWLILTDQYLLITRVSKNKELLYMVENWASITEIVLEEIVPTESNENKSLRHFTLTLHSTNVYLIQTKCREDCLRWISELAICNRSLKDQS